MHPHLENAYHILPNQRRRAHFPVKHDGLHRTIPSALSPIYAVATAHRLPYPIHHRSNHIIITGLHRRLAGVQPTTTTKAKMGSRYEVEITVGSARDLKNVNWRNGDLKPYAVLWIDAGARCSTRVDLDNGDNPAWDEKVVVPLPPASRLEDAVLYIDVVHANAAEGVKPLVGSARLPLRDVGGKASRNLRLKRPSGRPQGKLDVRVAVKEPARYYDNNPGGYPAPAGYGSSRDAYGGGYGAGAGAYGAAAGAGGYGAYAAAAPPSGYPGYGSAAPPPQAATPYGSAPPPYGAAPPTQGAGAYGSSVQPAYGAAAQQTQGAGGYGSSASAYGAGQGAGYGGTTGVGLDQSGGKTKKKGMGMAGGLAVGAAAGVLGGLALAGGASYVENKIEDRVTERVEEDMYGGGGGGGYDDYGGDDDY
ncbi:protein SRC2 homolog [Triticum urartu]|nr:protein SRC2 homolog [Triticum urartu]